MESLDHRTLLYAAALHSALRAVQYEENLETLPPYEQLHFGRYRVLKPNGHALCHLVLKVQNHPNYLFECEGHPSW